jgi:hypothetical protein
MMRLCLSGDRRDLIFALTHLEASSVDQFLSAIFCTIEIYPAYIDAFVDVLSEPRQCLFVGRCEKATKFFLVTDVIEHLLTSDAFTDWAADLAIRAELIRKLLDRSCIRRSVLTTYLEEQQRRNKGSRALYNILSLVLREPTSHEQPIGKQTFFAQTVASRLAYGSTVALNTVEHLISTDSVAEFQQRYLKCKLNSADTLLDDSFHSFRECPNIFALCIYFGAVQCFTVMLMNAPFIAELIADERIPFIAIRSGNLDIVRSLAELGVDFKLARGAAIRYHKHNLFDWISCNEPVPSDLVLCLRYKNGETICRHSERFAKYALRDFHALCVLCVESRFPAGLRWLLRLTSDPVDGVTLVKRAMRDVDCLLVLVRSGRIDAKCRVGLSGATLLHWAAKKGHTDLVRELLAFGEFGLTRHGLSALDYAVIHKQHGCARLLAHLTRCMEFTRRTVRVATPCVFVDRGGWLVRFTVNEFWKQVYSYYAETIAGGNQRLWFTFRGRVVSPGARLADAGIRNRSILTEWILPLVEGINKAK